MNKSCIACVGCSSVPLPALINGFSEISAANLLEPSNVCRKTSASVYPDIIFTVSAKLSPFCIEEDCISAIPNDVPPINAIAD